MNECDVVKRNLGLTRCNKLPQQLAGMIETPVNFKVPAVSVNDAAFWQAAIFNPQERIFLWPWFAEFENLTGEPVYATNLLGTRAVADAPYDFRFMIAQNMCFHKNAYTHRTNAGRIFLIDKENQIFGIKDSNGDFSGFNIGMLHTENLRFNDGSVFSASPIRLSLASAREVNALGHLIDGDFVSTLMGIVDVLITQVGAGAAGAFTVDVSIDCDGSPVIGLDAVDFILRNPDGTVHAIADAVEDSLIPGRYLITGAAFVDNMTLTLRDASQLSVDGYEHPEPLVINV